MTDAWALAQWEQLREAVGHARSAGDIYVAAFSPPCATRQRDCPASSAAEPGGRTLSAIRIAVEGAISSLTAGVLCRPQNTLVNLGDASARA